MYCKDIVVIKSIEMKILYCDFKLHLPRYKAIKQPYMQEQNFNYFFSFCFSFCTCKCSSGSAKKALVNNEHI